MNAPALTWVNEDGKYVNGWAAMLGTVKVATVGPTIGRQGELTQYGVSMLLPGIRPKEEYKTRPSEEEAKKVAEALVRRWFERLEE